MSHATRRSAIPCSAWLFRFVPSKRNGVVTFSADALTPGHFAACGVTSLDRVAVCGLVEAAGVGLGPEVPLEPVAPIRQMVPWWRRATERSR